MIGDKRFMIVKKHDLKHAIQRFGADLNFESLSRRSRLRDRRFTVISNDCWGAEVYKDLGLPFATPLIGTFLVTPCFLRLAGDCERILTSPLRFVECSRYEHVEALRARRWFPTGVLDDGVEIQFLHYATKEDAHEKWLRRLRRSHLDRLFFKLSGDKELCTDDDLARFDALPVRKLTLTAKPHADLASVVPIPNYIIDGKSMYAISMPHFDIVKWLNQE